MRESQQQHADERQQQHWLSLCEGDSRRPGIGCQPFHRAEHARSRHPVVSRLKAHRSQPVSGARWAGNEYGTGIGVGNVGLFRREHPDAPFVTFGRIGVLLATLMLGLFGQLSPLAAQGSAESGLFSLDTRYPAAFGVGVSGTFTVDTRFGLGEGSSSSGLFTVDTRFSGSTGAGLSGRFTLDTRGASIGRSTLAGRVTDSAGLGLGGATVSLLQSSVVLARASTDAAGNYALTLLPAGKYQVRVDKVNYLTGLRYGVEVAPDRTTTQNFALAAKPESPVTVAVERPAEKTDHLVPSGEQLKVFTDAQFVSNGIVDRTRMTVVFTHGWKSNPDVWARGMASNLLASGVVANLLAWDWRGPADTGLNLPKALSATPGQGEKLGQTLAEKLGLGYDQPIHFIGHSLGTLVNSKGADHLHGLHRQTGGAFDWRKTHMTLLDDAAISAVGGNLVRLTYAWGRSLLSEGTAFTCDWIGPIPERRAWVDNYISRVGLEYSEAVNVWLAKSADVLDPQNPVEFLEKVHGYACEWYSHTARTPEASILGHRYSFERLGVDAKFPSPTPYPLGSLYTQSMLSLDPFALRPANTQADRLAIAARQNLSFGVFGLESVVNASIGIIQTVSSAALDVVQTIIPRTPSGTAVVSDMAGSTPAYYVDQVVENVSAWSFQVDLQTRPNLLSPGGRVGSTGIAATAGETSSDASQPPPSVWIPILIPDDAALFSFDFEFTGEPAEDLLSANLAGTNVFALEARFMPEATTMNSGPIDVTRWAGKTVELYFGLLGGTSTNARVQVGAMRFYRVEAPGVTVEQRGNEVVLSWPATVQGYRLEATEQLEGSLWSPVTIPPAMVDLRNVVTNAVAGSTRFYRLRRE
jgi:pimeloyl-ACP methyl ester carboxylesterase